MTIRLLGNRILLKPVKAEKRTPGGIVLREEEVNTISIGEVVNVSTEIPTHEIKPGMKVWYNKYGATSAKIDDEEYLLVHIADIIGILEQ